MIMDRGNAVTFTSWYDWLDRAQYSCLRGWTYGPHMNGKNCGFVDGHAKWFAGTALISKDLSSGGAPQPQADPNSPYYGQFVN